MPTTRSYERSQCTLEFGQLEEMMKINIPSPGNKYLILEPVELVKEYKLFFASAAACTTRLNAGAVSKCAVSLFAMSNHEASMFGQSLAKAFSAMKAAGDKASTGAKLTGDVKDVYSSLKTKASIKFEATPVKKEQRQLKKMKLEPGSPIIIWSPSKVLNMYKAPPAVKQEQVACPTYARRLLQRRLGMPIYVSLYICMYICIYIYICNYIYIYIYMCQLPPLQEACCLPI